MSVSTEVPIISAMSDWLTSETIGSFSGWFPHPMINVPFWHSVFLSPFAEYPHNFTYSTATLQSKKITATLNLRQRFNINYILYIGWIYEKIFHLLKYKRAFLQGTPFHIQFCWFFCCLPTCQPIYLTKMWSFSVASQLASRYV